MVSSTGASVVLRLRRVRASDSDLPVPAYMSASAAGMDLSAAVDEPLTLAPGARAVVRTGFALELPAGFEGQVRPRSGLAARHGVTLVNSPGTIDADYRGEVQVVMINLGAEPFVVKRGERIAQLVISPVVTARVELAESLSETARGENGFGSSGR